MILVYGATDCNGRAAQRLYAERHPVRWTPAHTMFSRLHQQLCETGSFQKTARNRDWTARTELNEEIVLDMVETTPSLSTRASVLFTVGASFSREGIFNTHNSHSWAAANPHVTRTRAEQDRFLVNIWAGILGDHLIGPYILPDRLTGPRYLIFLEQVLPELLDSAHVTAVTRTSMWFQQDGAPAHFSISVRNHLNATCGERWIGRGGTVHWPPRSPDLSCLDYFYWGQMKSLVRRSIPLDFQRTSLAELALDSATSSDLGRAPTPALQCRTHPGTTWNYKKGGTIHQLIEQPGHAGQAVPGSCTIWRTETQNSAFLRYAPHGRPLQDPTSPLQRSPEAQQPAPRASPPREQSVVSSYQ
ncbi:uncharacterized protein TNCV_1316011 [Trichonephila clavipes]|nr:uncharacterized protein TNCV_1316011 [Trichonephila clavipes]